MLTIGLMSGTSCDGVDAALIETDGETVQHYIRETHLPYPIEFQKTLRAVTQNHGNFLEVEKQLTYYHFDVIQRLEVTGATVAAIGFHGHTIAHNPMHGICFQMGNPHLLAYLTGINVVFDFRRRDIARGGQGAPLVPIFHKTLMKNHIKPVAIVNIGGVSNITYIDESILLGYDLGPGNALINDMMMKFYDKPYDIDGKIAASGKVDGNIIKYIMQDAFFQQTQPKSLDRNHFGFISNLVEHHRSEDAVATLTMFTVEAIAQGIPEDITMIYLCGGGAKNNTIVSWLSTRLPKISIASIDDLGYKSDYIEAQAFAFLAARCLKNLPSSFSTTTGVKYDTVAGIVVSP